MQTKLIFTRVALYLVLLSYWESQLHENGLLKRYDRICLRKLLSLIRVAAFISQALYVFEAIR